MDALRLTHLQERLNHLAERVGRMELDLYGSGESIQVRIAKLEMIAIRCEVDAREDQAQADSVLDKLTEKIDRMDEAIDEIELRLSRRKENAELRQWIDFLGAFPGGVKGVAIAAVVAVAIIDLAVDVTGLAALLQQILGG